MASHLDHHQQQIHLSQYSSSAHALPHHHHNHHHHYSSQQQQQLYHEHNNHQLQHQAQFNQADSLLTTVSQHQHQQPTVAAVAAQLADYHQLQSGVELNSGHLQSYHNYHHQHQQHSIQHELQQQQHQSQQQQQQQQLDHLSQQHDQDDIELEDYDTMSNISLDEITGQRKKRGKYELCTLKNYYPTSIITGRAAN